MKTVSARTFYACSGCGSVFARWMGQCPDCGAWDTLLEERGPGPDRKKPGRKLANAASAVTSLADLRTDQAVVLPSGIGEFDNILGGGAVPGSTVLVGGEPGIGKSTLLLQAAGRFAQRGFATLYVSGEESATQIKRRAERLGIRSELSILTETNLAAILSAVEHSKPRVLIVDSIQTVSDPDLQSAPGTVSQVRDCAAAISDWARRSDAVALLVGHVTKDGFLAGPKVLEHLVDTVLQFEGDRRHWVRILRCTKNRYGATHEVGLFEMTEHGLTELTDPSARFLSDAGSHGPGSAVGVALEGRRPLLLEIQALVGQTNGTPQRVVAGLDSRRIAILGAVLQNVAGVQLAGRDVYANVLGGYMTDEPAVDLAAAMAIASSALKRATPERSVFIGEVGLSGDIRSVPQLAQRLIVAEKGGFTSAIVPALDLKRSALSGEIEPKPVTTISQALEML
ncbi:MAG TPA: DNA repair protein RadA [candidate division Zixibacteria bacterium]|jgi:DNA repair protein RadA/Sms